MQKIENDTASTTNWRVTRHRISTRSHEHASPAETKPDPRHPATKTNANAVQAMPVSVFIYEKLIEFKNESNQNPKLSDFVFFPDYKDRDKAMSVIAKQFKRIVAETKIAEKTDKKPTLYSLRHTSIMMRLING